MTLKKHLLAIFTLIGIIFGSFCINNQITGGPFLLCVSLIGVINIMDNIINREYIKNRDDFWNNF